MSTDDKHVFTQTSFEVKDEGEVERLRDQVKILQGKIKGYGTLTDILKSKKEECQRLRELNNTLTMQLNAEKENKNLDKEQNSLQESVSQSMNSTGQSSQIAQAGIQISQEKVTPVNRLKTGPVKVSVNSSNVDTAELFASQKEKTSEVPVIENGVAYPPQQNYLYDIKTEKYPMQESVRLENNTVITEKDSQLLKNKSIERSTSRSEKLTEENLECDSLRIEENDYVKIPRMPGMTEQSSVGATYGSSGSSSSGSLNLMEFPSENIRQEVIPKSKQSPDVCNPPSKYEASEVLQSLSVELVKSLHINGNGNNGQLATDGPTSSGLVEYITNVIIPEIRKLEDAAEKYKRENTTLLQELHRYRETNKRQMEKIQRLEHSRTSSPDPNSLSSQTHVVDWEYVKKSDTKPEHYSVEVSEAQKETKRKSDSLYRELEEQNKKLLEANQQWQSCLQQVNQRHRQEMEKIQHNIQISKEQEYKRQEEFDKILLNAKRRQNDEEVAKEEALGKVAQLTGRCEDLQMRYNELELCFNQTLKEKQNVESELIAVKLEHANNVVTHVQRETSGDHSLEITVLKEQLKVFQEDFDRERNDRARAQSAKDDLMKQISILKKENVNVKQQLRAAENSMKTTLNQNTVLQQEVIDLKNQLRQEREAIARPNPYQQQPVQYPGAQVGYNIGQRRPPSHPETDPLAQPVPPYMFQNRQQYGAPVNPQGDMRTFYTANHPHNAPELLPGAWNCTQCTYKNHPTRIICEICGSQKAVDTSTLMTGQFAGQSAPLMPRGENQPGTSDQSDLTTDINGGQQCC